MLWFNIIKIYIPGASTCEAQKRVAMEIAEQIITLQNPPCKDLAVNIVNCPLLIDSVSPENILWMNLAKKLGHMMSRFYKGKMPGDITCELIGSKMKNKSFLHAGFTSSVVRRYTNNLVNTINASSVAKSKNFKVKESHKEGDGEYISISADNYKILGTVAAVL